MSKLKTPNKAKTATKKPRIKLIDGKYAAKFFVRLEIAELKELEIICKQLSINTWTQTIRYLINNYRNQLKVIDSLTDRAERNSNNFIDLKYKVIGFNKSLMELQKIAKSLE